MKRIVLLIAVVLAFMTQSAEAYKIQGYVFDKSTETPLYSCDIALTKGDSIICTISTENSPQFEIKDLPAGKYKLEADAWGYERFYDEIDLTEDQVKVILFTPLPVVQLEGGGCCGRQEPNDCDNIHGDNILSVKRGKGPQKSVYGFARNSADNLKSKYKDC